MTKKTPSGGPAFPTHMEDDFEGMTLRDYFAGQALAGMVARGQHAPVESYSHQAYLVADAMLAERAK